MNTERMRQYKQGEEIVIVLISGRKIRGKVVHVTQDTVRINEEILGMVEVDASHISMVWRGVSEEESNMK